MPTRTFTAAEILEATPETCARVRDAIHRHGAMRIVNIFSPERLAYFRDQLRLQLEAVAVDPATGERVKMPSARRGMVDANPRAAYEGRLSPEMQALKLALYHIVLPEDTDLLGDGLFTPWDRCILGGPRPANARDEKSWMHYESLNPDAPLTLQSVVNLGELEEDTGTVYVPDVVEHYPEMCRRFGPAGWTKLTSEQKAALAECAGVEVLPEETLTLPPNSLGVWSPYTPHYSRTARETQANRHKRRLGWYDGAFPKRMAVPLKAAKAARRRGRPSLMSARLLKAFREAKLVNNSATRLMGIGGQFPLRGSPPEHVCRMVTDEVYRRRVLGYDDFPEDLVAQVEESCADPKWEGY
jgi:hypothetical protein